MAVWHSVLVEEQHSIFMQFLHFLFVTVVQKKNVNFIPKYYRDYYIIREQKDLTYDCKKNNLCQTRKN